MIDAVATDPSSTPSNEKPRRARRTRMTGAERRAQLLEVGRTLFATKGFEATSVEEIAAKAGVSKPVVYEHFGGKEGLYAVVVDREMRRLLDMVTSSLTAKPSPRTLRTGGLRPPRLHRGVHGRLPHPGPRLPHPPVDGLLRVPDLGHRDAGRGHPGPRVQEPGLRREPRPLYAQALVGMVALTGQWWLDVRRPKKAEVAAHLVNLAWHGLDGLEAKPRLIGHRKS